MTKEQIEQVIQYITGLLRTNPFSIDFEVKKKPKGIRIIYELTQEEMDNLANHAIEQRQITDI